MTFTLQSSLPLDFLSSEMLDILLLHGDAEDAPALSQGVCTVRISLPVNSMLLKAFFKTKS